jgi:hypothetical protein
MVAAGVHPPLDRKQLFVIALLEHFCKSVDVHAEGSLFVALCRRYAGPQSTVRYCEYCA